MLIAVEGMDNSGKTTFAHQLAKELRAIYVKHEFKPKDAAEFHHYHYHLLKMAECFPVVCDRYMVFSEPIYGQVIRGYTVLGVDDPAEALDALDLIVYCRPPNEVIFANNGRDQMDGVREKQEELLKVYDYVMIKGRTPRGCPVLVYDWTKSSAENAITLARLALEKVEATQQ